MNDALIGYEAEVGQSAKGVWYVKSLKVAASDLITFNMMLKDAMKTTEQLCTIYNEIDHPDPKEKD